ncbi:MAG: hypothetical protein JW747_00200, partial [Candidatus Aminicenantes bacterium]|nr:hypothetical protein [Candidatus Aminicenantes bacterium]
MEFEFLIDGDRETLEAEAGRDAFKILSPEGAIAIDIRRVSDNGLSVLLNGRSHEVHHARDKDRLLIWVDGELFEVREPAEDVRGRGADDGASEGLWRIASPMPGKVIKVVVAEGDQVHRNQTLAVVEAMKMENELKSPGDGTVKKVHASAGDLVDTNKPILEIEAG